MTSPINIKISTQHQKEKKRQKELQNQQSWNGRTIKMQYEDVAEKNILDMIKDKRKFNEKNNINSSNADKFELSSFS